MFLCLMHARRPRMCPRGALGERLKTEVRLDGKTSPKAVSRRRRGLRLALFLAPAHHVQDNPVCGWKLWVGLGWIRCGPGWRCLEPYFEVPGQGLHCCRSKLGGSHRRSCRLMMSARGSRSILTCGLPGSRCNCPVVHRKAAQFCIAEETFVLCIGVNWDWRADTWLNVETDSAV